MTRRQPTNKDATKNLPDEQGRDKAQPYAKEAEDYSGAGVVRPPKEQVGKTEDGDPRRRK
jgi:hypothetical protein